MSESFNYPRHSAQEAQRQLERAEAIIETWCAIYASVATLFTRTAPPATDEQALTIRRAWLRASA
jgi:hypothetical protein